jgi:hypothetical protein
MGIRPQAYLAGPETRRLTPWLWVVAMITLLGSWFVTDREPWLGPLFLLFGATIGTQGIDAIRTGRLVGRFPNRWPIDASRAEQPLSFWLLTSLYLGMGLMFAAAGGWMIVGWLS